MPLQLKAMPQMLPAMNDIIGNPFYVIKFDLKRRLESHSTIYGHYFQLYKAKVLKILQAASKEFVGLPHTLKNKLVAE